MQLRQEEFHRPSECADVSGGPVSLRDFEIASSAHDVLSAHHDRGFGDLDLFFSSTAKRPMIPFEVLGLNLSADPPLSRDVVFSDTIDFDVGKVMVLGVWGNRARPLLRSAETTPKSWETGMERAIP